MKMEYISVNTMKDAFDKWFQHVEQHFGTKYVHALKDSRERDKDGSQTSYALYDSADDSNVDLSQLASLSSHLGHYTTSMRKNRYGYLPDGKYVVVGSPSSHLQAVYWTDIQKFVKTLNEWVECEYYINDSVANMKKVKAPTDQQYNEYLEHCVIADTCQWFLSTHPTSDQLDDVIKNSTRLIKLYDEQEALYVADPKGDWQKSKYDLDDSGIERLIHKTKAGTLKRIKRKMRDF